jgi:hypothetical protein
MTPEMVTTVFTGAVAGVTAMAAGVRAEAVT